MNYEMIVLPADPEREKKIGFCVYERNGFEIYKYSQVLKGLPLNVVLDERLWDYDKNGEPVLHKTITVREDLKEGDEVICKGSFSQYWWNIGKVVKNGDYFHVDLGKLHVSLDFDTDDRHCWLGTGLINMDAVEKLCIG